MIALAMWTEDFAWGVLIGVVLCQLIAMLGSRLGRRGRP